MESEADIAYRLLIENSKKHNHSKLYKFISNADKISIKENKKIYGRSRLIEQAIPCFHYWFGFSPDVDSELLKKINSKI